MNSIEKGNITELEVQLYFVRMGYLAFTPINDGSPIDLVVKLKSGCKSIQVKTPKETATGFKIPLYSTAGGGKKKLYSSKDIDYFATVFNNRLYVIPISDVQGMYIVTLRLNTKYKNQNKIFEANNYLFE